MINKIFISIFLSFQFVLCHALIPNVNEMSTEEKVGQTLMVFFKGESVNEDARQLIEKAHIGNFIYYQWANSLNNPLQVQQLSNGLQKLARKQHHAIPLFISVDQEGGKVNRLNNGFTVFPSNSVVATSKKPGLAEDIAFAIGQELHAVGINMNLAPVVDINSNPARTVLGIRSFSSDPQEVIKFGRKALKGYKKANVIATLKHFPGYGEAAVDPHLGLPIVNKTKSELEHVELLPFRQLSPEAEAIMTAHIMMPALDPNNCATLSRKIVEELRNDMGYQGLIVSDSLVMQGVLDCCHSVEEAAVRAFEAGHDILVFGGKLLGQKDAQDLTTEDMLRIHKYLVNAVNSGRISQERLTASVNRILRAKKAYGLLEERYPNEDDIRKFVNTPEHQQLAQQFH